ncbi:MAG: efflux RND transporter permease subunit, partial [Alphaproteobacteria bacterium]|nr:efflux RND transporter permease subunit [Alphaproteobacteria bacterium]
MFSRIFIERPRFAIVISIVMAIAGIISVFSLPIALYPEVTPPEIVVSATYPGASAEVVARTIGIPLEEEINGVEDMLYMSSSSEDSSYQLTVTFKVGIDSDMAQVKVQNRIQQAMSKLPSEVQRQGLRVMRRSSNILGFISVFSPDNSWNSQDLSNFVQNNMKNNLGRVNGVGEVNVYSARLSMRVWLDADKIAALKLPIDSIKSAIEGQNYQPSLGKVGGMPGDGKQQVVYSLQTQGRVNEVEDFSNIIIRTDEEGGLVKLKDIARIEVGEESYMATSRYNGAPNVAIAIQQLTGANALEAMKNLKAELERMKANFPEGIDYLIGYDSTKYISASIEEVVLTLILTFALVVFVCYIFLQDWRSTLVPSLTIPVSLLATFAVMLALGYSLNMLTLFGLVLAIGLVVDDAIVVVERVLALMEQENLTPKQATIKAMEEVSSAIVATTLVLLAIFVPVGFLGGITGKIYQQFAVSISLAVFFSAVNALTLSPALCATILRPLKVREKGMLYLFNTILNKSRDTYVGIVGIFGRKIGVVAVVYAIALLIICGILNISQTSFLPSEDQGVIMANIQLPEGASRVRTQEFVDKISPIIRKESGVSDLMLITGISIIGGRGENVAMAFIVLKPWNERSKEDYSTNILNRLRAKLSAFPDAEIQLFEPPAIMGLGMSGGMDFRLQSLDTDNPQAIEQALLAVLGKINALPQVSYAYTTYTAKTPNIFVDIDRVKAESMKVAVGSIFSTLQ